MPNCYFLTVCSASAIDHQSNNASLFNLVEHINVPAGLTNPPGGVVPLELHAYWHLSGDETGEDFWVRFVMLAASGLETPGQDFKHRAVTTRFRTRTLGLPYPPVIGQYSLRVDWRSNPEADWRREPLAWPVTIQTAERKRPQVTH